MDSYVTLFINSSLATGTSLGAFSLLFLFLGRIGPIIALSPFFGARVLPHPVKLFFALCLFAIFLPKLLLSVSSPLHYDIRMVFLFLKEIFIGFILGFIMNCPFVIVQSAGMIIDHQRGGASLMVNDPTIQNQSSPLGTMFNMMLIYLFFLVDGPFLFIDAILNSYDIIPPDAWINPLFFHRDFSFWDVSMKLYNRIMIMSIQLASPALVAILMTDMFLGIANRLAPQVQITFLGLPLKSLLGLMLVGLGWYLLVARMTKESLWWVRYVNEIIHIFKSPSYQVQM